MHSYSSAKDSQLSVDVALVGNDVHPRHKLSKHAKTSKKDGVAKG